MQSVAQGEHRLTITTFHAPNSVRRFASVVLDIDDGITTIDGVEWLAARRDDLVRQRLRALAADARAGTISPERAFSERLAAIRPRQDEIHDLSRAYLDAIDPDAANVIARCRRAGIEVLLVSRGPRAAMHRLANHLAFDARDVHAVDLRFDPLGAYAGYDHRSPLAGAGGRRAIVDGLDVPRPVLVVGQGHAERRIDSFAHLASLVLI